MTRITAAAFLAASLLAVPAVAQTSGSAASQYSASQQDRQFLQHVAKDNQGEIRLALMAIKQAENPAVKAYARLMINDHAAFESQLANVLAELRVPSSNGGTSEDRRDRGELRGAYGRQFDVQFMRAQVQDHTKDVQQFAREMQTTRNPLVAGLAENGLPILQQHLALAEAVDRYVMQGQQQAMNAQQR